MNNPGLTERLKTLSSFAQSNLGKVFEIQGCVEFASNARRNSDPNFSSPMQLIEDNRKDLSLEWWRMATLAV